MPGLGCLAFALGCSEPVLRTAGAVYASAKHRLVPDCAAPLVKKAERVALGVAKYSFEHTAVGSVIRVAVNVAKSADAKVDAVFGAVSNTIKFLEADKPILVAMTLAEAPDALEDLYEEALRTAPDGPNDTLFKDACKAALDGVAAAIDATVEKCMSRAAAGVKLVKTGMKAAKTGVQCAASTANGLLEPYLACLTAGLRLAGTIIWGVSKLTALVVVESAKAACTLGLAATQWVRAWMAPLWEPECAEQDLPLYKATDFQAGDIVVGVGMWLYLATAFAVAWFIVMV